MPMDAAELKAQGNEEYGKRNYRKALELYTTLIETLKASEAVDPEQLSIAYRNRSAANVALYRFAPGLHDSIMSYNTLPTNNWKACLRAALCSCRTADLAAADTWIERAQQHAPIPTDAAFSKGIQEMKESIARKREFMSGGRFATEKLSAVLDRLVEIVDNNNASLEDFPYLLYRIRTVLRAHYSKISPDCQAFDFERKTDTATPERQAMQHVKGDDEGLKSFADLSLRMAYIAEHLPFHPGTVDPNIPFLKRLMNVPGCEDLFLSDLPDTSPQQEALYEGEFRWEKRFLLGESTGPRPDPPSPQEAEAASEDMAAAIMAHLTMGVVDGLTAIRGGVIAQRAFHQLAMIQSRILYRNACDRALTINLRLALQNPKKDRELAKGLAANGGLPGLAHDIHDGKFPKEREFDEFGFFLPLEFITVDDYRDIPVEEIAEALEYLGFKLHLYLPKTTCQECSQTCSKGAVIRIAQLFVRMYSAHGAKPFLMAARFSANINFYVSKMWHFSCGSETPTSACMTAEPRLDPGDSQAWVKLFNKWGTMHIGLAFHYIVRTSLPFFKPRVIGDSQRMNMCDNKSGCNGSRAVFGDDGVRVLKLCGNCQRSAYCSKQCQAEDWAVRHKEMCAKLKGGPRQGKCYC